MSKRFFPPNRSLSLAAPPERHTSETRTQQISFFQKRADPDVLTDQPRRDRARPARSPSLSPWYRRAIQAVPTSDTSKFSYLSRESANGSQQLKRSERSNGGKKNPQLLLFEALKETKRKKESRSCSRLLTVSSTKKKAIDFFFSFRRPATRPLDSFSTRPFSEQQPREPHKRKPEKATACDTQKNSLWVVSFPSPVPGATEGPQKQHQVTAS